MSTRYPHPGARTAQRLDTVGGPPWALPVSLLAVAALAQVAGLAALLDASGDLSAGIAYGPAQLGAVHLLGLAFLSVAIMAALLQLVPVLLRRRLARTGWAVAAGAMLAAGSWGLAAGLWTGGRALTAGGGTLVILGGLVLLVALVLAVAGASRAGALGATGWGLAASALWLAAVLALGGVMAANRLDPFLTVDRWRLIGAHAAVALLGWIGGTILAVALKLGPMFALSHGYRARLGTAALVTWHASVAPVAVGLGLGVAPLAAAGGVALLAACALAGAFLVDVARHRRRRAEAPLVHLGLGVAATGAACALMLAAWLGAGDMRRASLSAGALVLVGLGTGVTSGHLFKIVPMLVWTGRYARLAGTPGAPRLADMYPVRLAQLEVVAFAAGLLALVDGLLAGSAFAVRAGVVLLMAAALLTACAIAICAVGNARRRVPAAQPPPLRTRDQAG